MTSWRVHTSLTLTQSAADDKLESAHDRPMGIAINIESNSEDDYMFHQIKSHTTGPRPCLLCSVLCVVCCVLCAVCAVCALLCALCVLWCGVCCGMVRGAQCAVVCFAVVPTMRSDMAVWLMVCSGCAAIWCALAVSHWYQMKVV